MRKSALLMLWAGLGACTEAGALPANNGAYPGNPNMVPQGAVTDNAMFELLGRLEQLQSEVQQLRGIVEEQSQTIADLERKQTHMYSDLDERLQLLSSGNQPPQQAVQPGTPVAGQAPSPDAAAASGAATTAPVQPAAAASTVSPVAAAQQPTTPASATSVAPAQTAAPAATVAPPAPAGGVASKAGEQERYQAAYETLRNGHNAQAIQMLEALQADYPRGEFGDNTLYWLGEAYKINREFDKARAAFNKVVSQYPNSSKVPDALLKLGYIEFDQQNLAKARDYLTRVTTSYSGSTAAHLAAKKLAQMPQ